MIFLIYFILLQPLVAIIALLYAKLILWKMEQDLEDWISFGTGMDIFRCKAQRQEYLYYVNQDKNKDDPAKVIKDIREDLRSPKLLKPIYFQILWLLLKGKRFK